MIDLDHLEKVSKAAYKTNTDTIRFCDATTPKVVLELIAEIKALREVCFAAYQMAGAVNAPVRFLDALSDAATGDIEARAKTEDLLPVDPKETGSFPEWTTAEHEALLTFHSFFADNYQELLETFGAEAVVLYNSALTLLKKNKDSYSSEDQTQVKPRVSQEQIAALEDSIKLLERTEKARTKRKQSRDSGWLTIATRYYEGRMVFVIVRTIPKKEIIVTDEGEFFDDKDLALAALERLTSKS